MQSDVDLKNELVKRHFATEEKYTFVIIAGAISAMGFAVTQTKTLAYNDLTYIWLASIASWALCILLGFIRIELYRRSTKSNLGYLSVKMLEPSYTKMAKEIHDEKSEKRFKCIDRVTTLQLLFICLGAGFYIYWHVLQMMVRASINV